LTNTAGGAFDFQLIGIEIPDTSKDMRN